MLAERERAIAWLEEKLAEARATVEARDAAIAWLQQRLGDAPVSTATDDESEKSAADSQSKVP